MKFRFTHLNEDLKEIVQEYDFEKDIKDFPADEKDIDYLIPNNSQELHALGDVMLEETLTSFDLPGMTCSWRGCKFYKVRHGIYARVSFPENTDEAARNKINNCFAVGVAAAIVVLSGMSINPATIAGAAAAALGAFKVAFIGCIEDPNILSFLQYDLKYESHKV